MHVEHELFHDFPKSLMKLQRSANGEVRIALQSANESFRHLIQSGGEERVGTPLEDLFPRDLYAVDEWTGFAVGALLHPDPEEDRGLPRKRFLQYLTAAGSWTWTTVIFHRESGDLALRVDPLTSAQLSRLYRQGVPDLKQRLWMEVSDGRMGYWESYPGDGNVILSRSLARSLGMGAGFVILPMEQFLQLTHPGDVQNVLESFDHPQGAGDAMTVRLIPTDGETRHFRTQLARFYDDRGRLYKVMAHASDVTLEARAVEEKENLQAKLDQFLGASPDLYLTMNDSGRYLSASPNSEEIMGIPCGEFSGRSFGFFMEPGMAAREARRTFWKIVRGGVSGQVECRVRHPKKGLVWIHLSITLLPDSRNDTRIILVGRDITASKNRESKMEHMSTHDLLTGAYNRMAFEEELERLRQENQLGVGFVLADINGLKSVNDLYGHLKGDQLIREAAELLRAACPEDAMLCRIGGNEFALLVRGATTPLLDQVCGRISAACARVSNRMIPLSISFGAALRNSPDESFLSVYKLAQERMMCGKLLNINSISNAVVASLKEALKERNVETSDHMLRMERMAARLGSRLGLTLSQRNRLTLLAAMHDIGKVAVPDQILVKASPLTEDEWALMRGHCETGMRIATASHELSTIALEIGCHHERWDGGGYPFGKAGEEIPYLSRIVSVVDTYDVMTNRRSYKEPCTHRQAMEEIARCAGSQFDPEVAAHFIELFGEEEPDFSA